MAFVVSIPLKKLLYPPQRKYARNDGPSKSLFKQTLIQTYGKLKQNVTSANMSLFHSTLKSLAKRHRGLRVLASVCLVHYSPDQLLFNYKHRECLTNTSDDDDDDMEYNMFLKNYLRT